MSFSDNVDLEAQLPYSDSPEFDTLAETIATGLFDINSNIVTLQKLLKNLDTNPSVATEERAVDLTDNTREKFKELSNSIKDIKTWEDCAPSQRFTQQKLSREFSTALNEFQDTQRNLAEKQRSNIIKARTNIASSQQFHPDDLDHTERAEHVEPDLNTSTDLLVEPQLSQEQIDYQQDLIAEREIEIQGIEQGIEELNEIFTDLSTIVTEQGTIIDNIEANIYNVAMATRDASTQLTKAARYQRNSRGRAMCLLIILVIILLVILLGIFVG